MPKRRAPSVIQVVTGNAPPTCTYSGQTGCTDPTSGLYVIGSVTANISSTSVQSNWSSPSGGQYGSAILRFTTTLDQCVVSNAAQLTSYAFSMARYLQSNWQSFTSATEDIKTYVNVFLAGGASAFELIGAVLAVLSASEWAMLLLALGVTVFALASVFRCYAMANSGY